MDLRVRLLSPRHGKGDLTEIKVCSWPMRLERPQRENNRPSSGASGMASSDVFEHWRSACRKAEAAADAMLVKSMRAMDRMGEPPSQDEADEVRRLRRAADQEFHCAMACLHDGAHQAPPDGARSGAATASRAAR